MLHSWRSPTDEIRNDANEHDLVMCFKILHPDSVSLLSHFYDKLSFRHKDCIRRKLKSMLLSPCPK